MFLKVNSIIIFCFFFAAIECEDWCSIVAPDGRSLELGITRRWKSTDEKDIRIIDVQQKWEGMAVLTPLFHHTGGYHSKESKGRSEMIRFQALSINRFGIWAKDQWHTEVDSTDIQMN